MTLPHHLAQLVASNQPTLILLQRDDLFQLQAYLAAPPICSLHSSRLIAERQRGIATYQQKLDNEKKQLGYLRQLLTYNQLRPLPSGTIPRTNPDESDDVLTVLRRTAPNLCLLTADHHAQLVAYLVAPQRMHVRANDLIAESRRGGDQLRQQLNDNQEFHQYLKRVVEYNRLWQAWSAEQAKTEVPSVAAMARTPPPSTFTSWTEVGLGIHEDRSIYAFIPVPPLGVKVTLKAGLPLTLTGTRWQCIFDLAMQSPNGRTISKIRLLQSLLGIDEHTVPPDSYEDNEAAAEGISPTGIKSPAKYLSNTLAELRKQLTKAVQPKQPIRDLPLKVVGDEVDLGITIRPLLKDDQGDIRFGRPA